MELAKRLESSLVRPPRPSHPAFLVAAVPSTRASLHPAGQVRNPPPTPIPYVRHYLSLPVGVVGWARPRASTIVDCTLSPRGGVCFFLSSPGKEMARVGGALVKAGLSEGLAPPALFSARWETRACFRGDDAWIHDACIAAPRAGKGVMGGRPSDLATVLLLCPTPRLLPKNGSPNKIVSFSSSIRALYPPRELIHTLHP